MDKWPCGMLNEALHAGPLWSPYIIDILAPYFSMCLYTQAQAPASDSGCFSHPFSRLPANGFRELLYGY